MPIMFSPSVIVFMVPIIAIVGFFIFIVVQAVANSLSSVAKHRADAELKIVLAQRGMSAEEIVQVVTAKVNADGGSTSQQRVGLGHSEAHPLPPRKTSGHQMA
jgi:hypothetical protein